MVPRQLRSSLPRKRLSSRIRTAIAFAAIVVCLPAPDYASSPYPWATYYATKRTQPITIDGDLSDWTSVPGFTMAQEKFFFVGQGMSSAKWGGPKDLSATFRVQWDEKYLYLAIQVTDDKVTGYTTQRTATAPSPHRAARCPHRLGPPGARAAELQAPRPGRPGGRARGAPSGAATPRHVAPTCRLATSGSLRSSPVRAGPCGCPVCRSPTAAHSFAERALRPRMAGLSWCSVLSPPRRSALSLRLPVRPPPPASTSPTVRW